MLHRVRTLLSVRQTLGTLIFAQCFIAAWAAWHHSPTLNEPGHLVAGLHQWQSGDTAVYRVNPPLVRLIATLPLSLARDLGWIDYKVDLVGYSSSVGARPEFLMGERFVAHHGPKTMTLLRIARLTSVCMLPLGTLLVFHWASLIAAQIVCVPTATSSGSSWAAHEVAGMIAAILWALDPMMLGHSSLITPDAIATIAGGFALYRIWRIDLLRPSSIAFASVATGLAMSCKTTHLLLLPITLLWIAWLFLQADPSRADRPTSWRLIFRFGHLSKSLLLVLVVTPLTLAFPYGFNQVGRPLGSFRFVSQSLSGCEDEGESKRSYQLNGNRFEGTWVGALPVPLPADFVIGIDLQKKDFESYPNPSYLFGGFSDRGWWHYYIWVVVLKTPIGTLLVVVLSMVWLLRQKRGSCCGFSAVFFVWATAAGYFVFVSSQSGFSHHGRYLLPAFLPLAIASSTVMTSSNARVRRLVISATAATCVACLASTPNQLSYFNLLAGGFRGGPRYLIHSNVDWGQDLLRLQRWSYLRARNAPTETRQLPVFLAFQELYNPFALTDYPFADWPDELRRTADKVGPEIDDSIVPEGFYAISVNLVFGAPRSICDHRGDFLEMRTDMLPELARTTPYARIGGSVLVFTDQQIQHAIDRLNL